MLQKLTHCNEKDFTLPVGVKRQINHLPTPCREISEKDFKLFYWYYSYLYREYTQVYLDEKLVAVHIFWTIDQGYVETENGKYFAIGCEHDWKIRKVGNCLNEYTCKNCGYSHTVDSSD